MCEHAHEVDIQRKSAQFAERMEAQLRGLDLTVDDLAELTGFASDRLAALRDCKAIPTSQELRLVGLLLGIGMDELFPLAEISHQDIHDLFRSLSRRHVGLIAAEGAPGDEEVPMEQEELERCVVQLHHCAECLSAFPSSEVA